MINIVIGNRLVGGVEKESGSSKSTGGSIRRRIGGSQGWESIGGTCS